MVCGSLPICTRIRTFVPSSKRPRFHSRASSNQRIGEDGTTEPFLKTNTVADFMRFKTDSTNNTGELQTALVTYKKKFPWSLLQPFLQVDLVSTIHIADQQYFDILQKELELYDCVLYEMITSRELLEARKNSSATRRLTVPRTRGFSIIGCIQRLMSQLLTLDFQLDSLNYEGEKWYHADLDFETFVSLQLEKGESLFTFARDMALKSTKAIVEASPVPEDLGPWRSKLLRASRVLPMPLVGILIIGSLCDDIGGKPGSPEPSQEVAALLRLDFSAAMKIFLAKRLTSEFTGETSEVEEQSVVIGERNKAATAALRRAINEGHKKIAVLYGGGHMPDLGRRLRDEFDLVPSQVKWVTAWSIMNRELESQSFPFLKTLAELTGWPLNRYQTIGLLIFSGVLAVDLWFWEVLFNTALIWASQAASAISPFGENVWVG